MNAIDTVSKWMRKSDPEFGQVVGTGIVAYAAQQLSSMMQSIVVPAGVRMDQKIGQQVGKAADHPQLFDGWQFYY